VSIDILAVSGGKILEEWSANSAAPFMEEIQQQARERIEQELRVARRIQQASLPEEVHCVIEFREFHFSTHFGE
jgi:hypothetical protein